MADVIDNTVTMLYKEMVEINDFEQAKLIQNMYNKQEKKYDKVTEFFNNKIAELEIIQFSKSINKESLGMIVDTQIKILQVDNQLSPILKLTDIDGKEFSVVLSISVMTKIKKCLNTANCSLSILQYLL